MNVLSCFDGISCAQVALQRAGIAVENYYASEIDKYAITITQANHPATVQLGTIENWKEWNLPKIDLIVGGSPCQGFSMAGKMLNFEDERSKLFFTFADIIDHYRALNPDLIFVLENVEMEGWCREIISERLGVDYVTLNGSLVSAQNRVRLWWTNLPIEGKPKDKGILLKDILETEVGEKYYLSEKAIQGMLRHKDTSNGFGFYLGKEKSNTILSRYYKDGKECLIDEEYMNGEGEHPSMVAQFVRETKDGFHQYRDDEKKSTIQGTHVTFEEGKVHCVTSAHKPMMLQRAHGNNQGGEVAKDRGERRYYDKTQTLGAHMGTGGNNVPYVNNIRRLTEIEVERLFTLPDNYTAHVSATQRYKCLGNGWIVDVATWIFGFIGQPLRNHRRQRTLF